MKIELKKLKIFEAGSEETTCFNAELYIEGKNVGYAKNDGRGGCTDYMSYEKEGRDLITQAEAFCKTLPDMPNPYSPERPFKMDLKIFIDNLVTAELLKKDQNKIQKKFESNIISGIIGGTSYKIAGFKGSPKLADLVKTPRGKEAVEKLIADVKSKLTAGETIWNDNLEELQNECNVVTIFTV